MGVIDEALARAIDEAAPPLLPRPDPPDSIDEAAAYFGGRNANRAIADRYGVSIRTVQRWRAFERGEHRQIRRPPAETRRKIIAAARRRQLDAWRAANTKRRLGFNPLTRIRQHGLNMRIRAWIIVSKPPPRVHTMPAEPGPMQYIAPELLGPTLAAWEAGDRDEAGEQLEDAFFVAYGLGDVEVDDIEWARVRIL